MDMTDMRVTTQKMMPHLDFDIDATFFYDETNNVKKLHLKKGDFNVDYAANFVVGGLSYIGTRPNVDDIFDGLNLQPTVVEVYLKLIATGDFADCLKSDKLTVFLNYLLKSPLYLHFSSLNLLYYSLVDIVDSIIPIGDGSKGFDYRIVPVLKNDLYIACKAEMPKIVKLFFDYQYPNIKQDKIKDFIAEFLQILEPYNTDNKIGKSIKLIQSMMNDAAENDELPFITDEDDYILVQKFVHFYARPIYMFINSKHEFDNELEVKSELEEMGLTYHEKTLTNFSFHDSKSDKLIQASDIIIGLLGKLFKYINSKSIAEIKTSVEAMSAKQLANLDLFFSMFEKTINFNPTFLHYVDAQHETQKIAFMGTLVNKDI